MPPLYELREQNLFTILFELRPPKGLSSLRDHPTQDGGMDSFLLSTLPTVLHSVNRHFLGHAPSVASVKTR